MPAKLRLLGNILLDRISVLQIFFKTELPTSTICFSWVTERFANVPLLSLLRPLIFLKFLEKGFTGEVKSLKF